MDGERRERAIGWLAVAAQGVALIALALGPGDFLAGPLWLTVVGVALVGVGGVIMLAATAALGSALTPTPVPVPGAGLRRNGIYRFARHPIYSGLLVLALGVVLIAPSPWRVLWWFVLLGVLFAKSLWEERMLTQLYPDYDAYREQVGRFFPHLPRS